MRECFQFKGMSMLDHGWDVRGWYLEICRRIRGNPARRDFRIPDWLDDDVVISHLEQVDDRLVELYQVYHDCGKPLCRMVDVEGRQHFPDHAMVSRIRWLECSDGSPEALQVADLIEMDMDVHLLRAAGVEEFARRPQALTLLLTGLAEVHSNAEMFGGTSSTGFKIKYKNLDRFGARIVALQEGR